MRQAKEESQVFHNLIEQHKGILIKVARTYCKNEDDRQDLMQEMMVQIWKAMPRYNTDFAVSTFLYRICLNVAISYHRKNSAIQSSIQQIEDRHFAIEDTETNDKEQHLILLDQFINELNELDKALMLLYLEDKSHLEIADVLGLTVTNVATKVGRIKDKLKKRFSQFKL